jgi:hypothetical protein
VLNATERAAVGQVIEQAGPFDYVPALAIGAGTYLASKARGAVIGPLVEADEDDDLGVQGLLRWAGDLWGGLGPVALIVFPLVTLALFGVAVLILVVVERRVEARGERANVPFVYCGQLIHASDPARWGRQDRRSCLPRVTRAQRSAAEQSDVRRGLGLSFGSGSRAGQISTTTCPTAVR